MTGQSAARVATTVLAVATLLLFGAEDLFAMQSGPSSQAVEFLRLARADLASSDECASATNYLRGLPVKQQLEVARAVLSDADARIAYVGANVLIEHGRRQEAVPALAAIIASGRDDTQLKGRLGYAWVHGDDQTLFLRMAISINRYLLNRYDSFRGEERTRVEKVLMGGLLEKSSEPFSKERAQKLIADWESKLRSVQK
jgi:hypothetical protein